MSSKTGEAESRLRLDTLLELRWCSIAVQTMAVLIASVGFNLNFNYRLCLLLTAASAIANIVLGRSHPGSYRLKVTGAAAILSFDIILLSSLAFCS